MREEALCRQSIPFLLTPLREGRPEAIIKIAETLTISTHAPAGGATRAALYAETGAYTISTHAPAGGATKMITQARQNISIFLLTPLREGRPGDFKGKNPDQSISTHAPAGGATYKNQTHPHLEAFLLTPLREGRPPSPGMAQAGSLISTHAPAGGATAIFHKSVMRFCGKLPKDDTVLCLASFGFPRRDPKAVYLAWISCANLPQKCVRQGLALKDQGTSCFHEGLASHAFDPVLV